MALNPQYEEIGKGFVTQYYAMFDDPMQRPNLVNLYNVSVGAGRVSAGTGWGSCGIMLLVGGVSPVPVGQVPNLNFCSFFLVVLGGTTRGKRGIFCIALFTSFVHSRKRRQSDLSSESFPLLTQFLLNYFWPILDVRLVGVKTFYTMLSFTRS